MVSREVHCGSVGVERSQDTGLYLLAADADGTHAVVVLTEQQARRLIAELHSLFPWQHEFKQPPPKIPADIPAPR
jgi:hypothetical protein